MASPKPTLYEVLGLTSSATDEDIRRAYKALAKKYHPDLNQGSPQAETAFKAVGRAWEVLGDPAKRAQYDSALKQESSQNTPARGTERPMRGKETWMMGLFGVLLVFAVILFFFDTPKGIYFLVVAVALEIRASIESLRSEVRRMTR